MMKSPRCWTSSSTARRNPAWWRVCARKVRSSPPWWQPKKAGSLGHVLFSELPIETGGGPLRAAALAPLAVAPEHQRQGIGAALIRAGLEACRNCGVAAAIVLGDPDYYPRFGFSSAAARNLRAPFSGPAFMALELAPGCLDGVTGTLRYAAAFGLGDTSD